MLLFSLPWGKTVPSLEQAVLTLFGTGGDTFIPLFFLDQFLSAEFLSKISQLCWQWKWTFIKLIWKPAKLIESYKHCGAKDEHFSCFHSSCQWRLRQVQCSFLTKQTFLFKSGFSQSSTSLIKETRAKELQLCWLGAIINSKCLCCLFFVRTTSIDLKTFESKV